MDLNWQEIITYIIVAVAAVAVGRRILSQLAALRKSAPGSAAEKEATACSGCDGCGPRKAVAQPQLVNISLNAPQRIRPPRPAGSHDPALRN